MATERERYDILPVLIELTDANDYIDRVCHCVSICVNGVLIHSRSFDGDDLQEARDYYDKMKRLISGQ